MLGDGVAVTRSRQQRAQDQEIEGAAKELDARRWLLAIGRKYTIFVKSYAWFLFSVKTSRFVGGCPCAHNRARPWRT